MHANKHDNIIQEVNCRKILELYFDGVSQRTISSSTGHSRNTVSEVVKRAKKLGLESFNDTMTNSWLVAFLFPEKQAIEKGYFPVDWEKVHKELQKKNVTLALLHYEYATEARESEKLVTLLMFLIISNDVIVVVMFRRSNSSFHPSRIFRYPSSSLPLPWNGMVSLMTKRRRFVCSFIYFLSI